MAHGAPRVIHNDAELEMYTAAVSGSPRWRVLLALKLKQSNFTNFLDGHSPQNLTVPYLRLVDLALFEAHNPVHYLPCGQGGALQGAQSTSVGPGRAAIARSLW